MAHQRIDSTDLSGIEPGPGSLFEGHHRGLRDLIVAIADILGPAEIPEPPGLAFGVLVGQRLAALRGMAEVHFADEEKLMEDVGYPLRDDHMLRHRDFLKWMDRLEAAAAREPQRLAREHIPLAMVDWWEAHAHNYDRLLADFLCRGGN